MRLKVHLYKLFTDKQTFKLPQNQDDS
ncbi:hypothetical protein N9414_03403 [Nodularia spumigena CCY9414]|nr:hypothetical protein N9414_03403 [Nodularia spumigena CCY9414]